MIKSIITHFKEHFNALKSRWGVMLSILGIIELQSLIDHRIYPNWFIIPVCLLLIFVTGMVVLSKRHFFWLKIEYITIIFAFIVIESSIIAGFVKLIDEILNKSMLLNGLMLFFSGVVGWIINMIIFAILFWRIDDGGFEVRWSKDAYEGEWAFPQCELQRFANWKPIFADYFAIAFNTATALSPADVAPLSARVKLLMIVQSLVSMAAIIIIITRAIDYFG